MSQGVAIISATAALFALVFSIFGASWLNQRNTQNLLGLNQRNLQNLLELNQSNLQNLLGLNQRNIEKLLEQMGKHFDARFDTLLSEIRRLDQRIDALDQRLNERVIH